MWMIRFLCQHEMYDLKNMAIELRGLFRVSMQFITALTVSNGQKWILISLMVILFV